MTSFRDKNTIIIFLMTITTNLVTSVSLSSASNLSPCPDQCTCTTISIDNRSQNHVKCYGFDGLKNENTKALSIHSLDISNNNLTRIPYALEKLKDLTTLDLSFNHLSEVGHFGKRIQKLNISYNKITSGKLSNLPVHLKYLDLSHNDITYLPLELKNLTYLRSIELTDNKIHCTCETLEIRNWLQHNHVWTNNHIKCTYPIEFKGKSWLQIRQSDVCANDNNKNNQRPSNDEENELMLGDEAFHDEGSGDRENVEELGKEYLPIDDKNDKKLDEYKAVDETEFEGSGDDNVVDEPSSLDNKNELSSSAIPDAEDVTSEHPSKVNVDHTDDSTDETTDEATEASGGGPLPMVPLITDIDTDDNDTSPSTTWHTKEEEEDEDEDDDEDTKYAGKPDLLEGEGENDLTTPTPTVIEPSSTEPTEATSSAEDIFGQGLGIVQFPNAPTTEGIPSSSEEPLFVSITVKNVESEAPVPVTSRTDGTLHSAEIQKANIKIPDNLDPNDVAEASSGDSTGTYILLGIILLLLIALILYVAIKRSRARRRCRHEDAENPKETELMDMDKKNVGKPIHKNGAAEHAPLINDRTKSDLSKPISVNGKKVPYELKENDKNAQEPLLTDNKSSPKGTPQTESNNNVPNNTLSKPITPAPTLKTDSIGELTKIEEGKPKEEPPVPAVRQSIAPKSPEAPIHQYKFGSYPPPSKPKASSGDESGDGYNSSSPRPSRYSPVYSPETGRVKIKLTETPKPKTPLLVTRSRSNAGDIITTPTLRADAYKDAKCTPDTANATTTSATTKTTTTNGQ